MSALLSCSDNVQTSVVTWPVRGSCVRTHHEHRGAQNGRFAGRVDWKLILGITICFGFRSAGKAMLNDQNIKYEPSSTNLALVESWGEAKSYRFPTFSLWIVSSRSVPAQEPAKCTGKDTSLTFHWDLLPGSCSECFLGVGRDTNCYTFPISISQVPTLAWYHKRF